MNPISTRVRGLLKKQIRVFLSHKVRAKGEEALKIKRLLEQQSPRLHVFVSPEIEAAREWERRVWGELRAADILVLFYSDPSEAMDWCLFESGFFAGHKKRPKLMCLHPECVPVPQPLRSWENVLADDDGVEKMLRAIFLDESLQLRPDLFEPRNEGLLRDLVDNIVQWVGPGPEERVLAPRLKIKVPACSLAAIWSGAVPDDAVVMADDKAAAKFDLTPGSEASWPEFVRILESTEAMPHLTVHFARAMRGALTPKEERWTLPPVRFRQGRPAWGLTLARVLGRELRLAGLKQGDVPESGELQFEFVLSKPWESFRAPAGDSLSTVYHLLCASWHCRWRVTEGHLKDLKGLRAGEPDGERVAARLAALKADIHTVLLDCLNRGLRYGEDALAAFEDVDQKMVLDGIVREETGRWPRAWAKLLEAVQTGDLDLAVKVLEAIQAMTGDVFRLCTERLRELAAGEKGEARLAWASGDAVPRERKPVAAN